MGVTLQNANPAMSTVSRQPQTTAAPAQGVGVPFGRMSRHGQIPGPSQVGQAFGSLWTPTLRAVGGFLRSLEFYVTATGGNYTAATAAADAPYNTIQNLYLRDPYGQPIVQLSGYSLFLANLYGGQTGALGFGNAPSALPSWIPVNTTTGAFTFRLQVPIESDASGYCSLPFQNASSQPNIQISLNTATVVYSAKTGSTDPTLTLALDETYWMTPVDNPQAAPADVGSSVQWSELIAQQSPSSGAFSRIQLARVGTYVTTVILVLRDSTGARVDAWPLSDLQLWIDGVPVLMETLNERQDKMFTQFGVARPTGVIAYTFKNSIQSFVSSGDTYDLVMPTTPATLLEIAGTYQTITNQPAKIQVVLGELYPLGGIPYAHLGS
jgi:hypothetical protein